MGISPFERVKLGSTDVEVTRLGLGTAEIGGLYTPVSDEQATSLVDHVWHMGVRYFDTAPLYGFGNAERRLGLGLAGRDRDSYTLSTKIGRLLYPPDAVPADAEIEYGQDSAYSGIPDLTMVLDYSGDGVRRSIDDSLERIGVERIDIVYIHDPDAHWQPAIDAAYPALHDLRSQGVVGAIGAGMNQAEMLARFAREGDFDVFMLAGRYTLLDQPALPELLPLCVEKGISIVDVGVMNSGILAGPRPGARFNYEPAPPERIERAQQLAAVCDRHGVSLKTAAIRFPLAYPAVAAVAAGVRTTDHFDDYPAAYAADIPTDLWAELRAEGLIPEEAPTP